MNLQALSNHGTIVLARVRHLNGEGTPKQLVLVVATTMQDADGGLIGNWNLTIPVPYDTPLGDIPEWEDEPISTIFNFPRT